MLEVNGDVLAEGDQFFDSDSTLSGILGKRRRAEALMHAQAQAAQAQVYPLAHLYEFNGTTFVQLLVGVQAGASLLPLPNGQVLVMGYDEQIFSPADASYDPSWAPTVSSAPSTVSAGGTYKISGTQFNGLSQACAFGDELQCATNYPLVRITNTATGDVIYARTHGHSTMGVATGSMSVSTNFDVPAGIETGASTLQVVADGIPSAPVSVTVQ